MGQSNVFAVTAVLSANHAMQADVNVPRRAPVQGQASDQDFEGRSPLDVAITRTILVPGKNPRGI